MTQFLNTEQEREDKLSDIHRQEEESATERQAQKLGFPYLNLATVPVERDSLHFITQKDVERTQTIVLQKKGETLKIGAVDPSNQETKQVLEQLTAQGFKIEVFMISKPSLKKALGEFKFLPSQIKGGLTSGEVSLGNIETFKKELGTFASLKDKLNKIDQSDTGLLLEIFLGGALNLEASDVHVEPQENQVQ
ncbi:MAG: hypothetical protein AAB476_02375, partial [Patescibacteria group bacterium]